MANEKLINRIQKLFARAKSDNMHEAQVANDMAYKLMMEQKLTREDIFGKNPDIIETELEGEKYLEIWRWGLLTACAWGRSAHTVRIEERYPDKRFRIIAIVIGGKDASKAAIYLFRSFEKDIEEESRRLVKEQDLHGVMGIESWRRGAVVAIQERILNKKNNKKPKAELRERALVLVRQNKEKIKEHVQKEYQDAVKPRMWKQTDYNAFDRGYRFGLSLVMPAEESKRIEKPTEAASSS